MKTTLYPTRFGRRSPRAPARPHLELLESRNLLSVTWPGLLHPITTPAAETLDVAPSLTANLNAGPTAEVVGALGNGPAGAADVNWYSITLTAPAHVAVDTLDRQGGSPLVSVVSLYASDPNDPNLSFTMGGYNLAAQADGAASGGDAHLAMDLTAGTYYVAVSGSGNRYFHPFVAGSGLAGSTGPYGLRIAATNLDTDPGPIATWYSNFTASTSVNDTKATALDLGDVSNGQLVQAPGAIGDDSGDPTNPDPNEVDLYHFQVSGSGRYALAAEVFAGRIGSALDPGLSLFRVDTTGQLVPVDANDNSFNNAMATNGTAPPMFTDSVLLDGLTAGDYYLAVSSAGNVPDVSEGAAVGQGGVFDPNVSQSGTNGWSTGNYVLSLSVQPASQPPQVIASTPQFGVALQGSPTYLQVQFDEPVNIQPRGQQIDGPRPSSPYVFIQGNGQRYIPHLESFDPTTNTANFVMFDALPTGAYQLHLSGPAGLTDLAQNPLPGNDPSGDYVVYFRVDAPPRGDNGNSLLTLTREPNDSPAQAQALGTIYWNDLLTGNLAVQRNANPVAADTADYYQFHAAYNCEYTFTLTAVDGGPTPAGLQVTLFTPDGQQLTTFSPVPGTSWITLTSGNYLVRVDGWSADQAPNVGYRLAFGVIAAAGENAPPIPLGPAPAVRLRLVSNQTPLPNLPLDTSTASNSGQGSLGSGVVQSSSGGPSGGTNGTSGTIVPISNTLSPATTGTRTPSVVLTVFVNSVNPATVTPNLLAVVPAEVLQALAAGPVGGIGGGERGTTVAAAERLTLSSPQLAALDAVVQTTILTQSGTADSGNAATANSATVEAVRQTVTLGTQSMQRLLDRLFSLGDWSFLPLMPSGPATESVPSEKNEPEDEVQLPTKQPPLWAGALVLVGALVGARQEETKRRAVGTT